MDGLISFVQFVASPLMPIMEALIAALAGSEHRAANDIDCTVAAFAVSTCLIGILCVLSTCWIHARLRKHRRRAAMDIAMADAALYFREALLEGAARGVVVLREGDQEWEYFGDGKMLYECSIASPQSAKVIRAINALTEDATPFSITVESSEGSIAIRGRSVDGRAAIYFDDELPAVESYREVLDALPMPIWVRGAESAVRWANRAFLSVLGLSNVNEAPARAPFPCAGQEATAKALPTCGSTRARTSLIVNGERRAYSTGSTPVSANCIAEFALDVTDLARRESAMQLALDAQEDMLEHSPLAVAVFDRDQKLTSCNRAYADLWGLPRAWLDARLPYGEILERLRDERKLPERRNFSDWKLAHTRAISALKEKVEESWHLPSGKSVRITAWPHLQGGFFLQVEDITERLHWQAEFSLLAQVQKATLDTLNDGIAIFGTDGRLVLHNERFAAIWKLSDSELEGQPHFAEIANLCTARIGRDGIWGIVSCGINSGAPESLGEWGKTKRADGRTISLALSRLPNGSTVANFVDLTDLERFDEIKSDLPYALA